MISYMRWKNNSKCRKTGRYNYLYKKVEEEIKRTRTIDIVGRYGGEKFIVILHTDIRDCYITTEK